MGAGEGDHPGVDDPARLAAWHSYAVLDRPRPAVLDELTGAAAAMFDTSMAAVSLVDADWQWFAGSAGLADAQTPLDVSFCAPTVPTRQPLIVPDATRDPRLADYHCVTDAPQVRFYAGVPILDEDGHALGAMCVIDEQPRTISDRQRDALTPLAGPVRLRSGRRAGVEGVELCAQGRGGVAFTFAPVAALPLGAVRGALHLLGKGLAGGG